MDNIALDRQASFAAGALSSSGFTILQRPLAWVLLPATWPASTPLLLQGAVTEALPDPASADWHDLVDRFGAPVTLTGSAGQIVTVETGLFLGIRHLRFRVGTAPVAAQVLPCGAWYVS